MIDEAFRAETNARPRDPQRAIDEWSMRLLELALAGMALVAAVHLTAAR